MPSRVIRAEINQSESLSRVSLMADLTFRALLVAVDDFGRMDARPLILKAALFPLREEIEPADICEWIAELHDEGCIQVYEVEGRPFLQMTGWEKHRGKTKRAETSKCPEMQGPGDSRDILGISGDPPAGYGVESRSRERESSGPSPQGGLDTAPEQPDLTDAPREPGPPAKVLQLRKAALTEADVPVDAISAAFADYGKRHQVFNPALKRMIVARMREAPPGEDPAECVIAAVHGYMFSKRTAGKDFDVLGYLRPKTVYAARNYPGYLAAAMEAREAGHQPPFTTDAEDWRIQWMRGEG